VQRVPSAAETPHARTEPGWGPARTEAPMFNALSDFILFGRVERRLSELTCKAYERDVRACIEFLRAQGTSA
jgi:hypothetical protein